MQQIVDQFYNNITKILPDENISIFKINLFLKNVFKIY